MAPVTKKESYVRIIPVADFIKHFYHHCTQPFSKLDNFIYVNNIFLLLWKDLAVTQMSQLIYTELFL
jgi:hypothetical protein